MKLKKLKVCLEVQVATVILRNRIEPVFYASTVRFKPTKALLISIPILSRHTLPNVDTHNHPICKVLQEPFT